MSIRHDDIMASLPPERRKRIESVAATRLAVNKLKDLRKSLGLSQQELANLLEVTQPAISKFENMSDMQISTLASIIEAMGGHLEIVAHFPDREPITLYGLAREA